MIEKGYDYDRLRRFLSGKIKSGFILENGQILSDCLDGFLKGKILKSE
jgi:hypothetical protein